jgi:hypothetical protein
MSEYEGVRCADVIAESLIDWKGSSSDKEKE